MITTVYLNTIEDVLHMIADQGRNEHIDRIRSTQYYRGLPNVNFKLSTSLTRNCKDKAAFLEPSVLSSFTKYASIEDPTLKDSVWKQMIVGQHYGLPTRLLDWTYSPLVALHFAMSENDFNQLSKHDCVVWRMDMTDVNRSLPEKYQKALREKDSSVFSVDTLTKVVNRLDEYDADMGTDSLVNIEPPSVDVRIVNQYSFFSIIPSQMDDIEGFFERKTEKTIRYIINRSIRWDVRDLLDQYNVNERIIYPGLDGLSKLLARHYFVR